MNNQQKKEYLSQYRYAVKRAARTDAEIAQWRSVAEKVTPTLSGMPGGGTGSRIESAVEQMDALREKLNDQMARCAQIRIAIDKAIEGVPDERLRYLLELRYVDGCTFEQIAVNMHYDWRHVVRLHGFALSALKINDVMECHTQNLL